MSGGALIIRGHGKPLVELTWHDNSVDDSDQAERATGESEYDKRCAVPIAEAIAWAHALPYAVTLFLYDED